jgi:hypothetical protein
LSDSHRTQPQGGCYVSGREVWAADCRYGRRARLFERGRRDLQSLINAHVEYVNGGFGTEEADALRAEARNYPLELMFSRRGEGERAEFVADVRLQILDATGRVIVDRASQGPIFLARLPKW